MAGLRGYRLASRVTAPLGGERRASLAGAGGEFLDYRPYEPGDEPRHVDWNVFARSGRLYTRQYHAERSARVYCVVDESASMRDKLAAARRFVGFLRGFARADVWFERPVTNLAAELPGVASERPGLVLIVSDGLEPLPGLRAAFALLASRGFDVSFVQVLSREDLEPPPGPWRVRDAESADAREVNDAARRAYLQRLHAHLEGLAGLLRALGLRHARARDDDGAPALWARLRRAGILERGA